MNDFPTIIRRYFSTLIDSIFIISMFISAGYLFQDNSELVIQFRVGIAIILFFVYEPFCTSFYCTIGQKLTNIRVRSNKSKGRISLPQAYIRVIGKVFLGFISFFTIPLTKNKRAIHDLMAGSVVLNKTKS